MMPVHKQARLMADAAHAMLHFEPVAARAPPYFATLNPTP